MVLTCSKCGREFKPGNRLDGIPNGVGFQMEDGDVIAMCADCLIHIGSLRVPDHSILGGEDDAVISDER